MNATIKKIVVVGADVTGLSAALYLSSQLKGMDVNIEIVDCVEINRARIICSTPQVNQDFQAMGFNLQNMMSQTDATFNLGTAYQSWLSVDSFAFNSFSHPPEIIGFFDFHQLWVKSTLSGENKPFHKYSMSAVAAQKNRFALPSQLNNQPLAHMPFGINFNAKKMHKYMLSKVIALGININKGQFEEVISNADGTATAIKLVGTDDIVEGDFFIDCSGQSALLMKQIKSTVERRQLNFGVNRFAELLIDTYDAEIPPQKSIKALPHGYLSESYLKDKLALIFSFNSAQTSDDEVLTGFKENMLNVDLIDAQFSDLEYGFHDTYWVENCLAIGASAFHFPEFELNEYSLMFSQLRQFIKVFPNDNRSLNSKVYNQQQFAEMNQIKDYSLLPLKLNKCKGLFWENCSNIEMSSVMDHRLALFENSGRIANDRGSMITKHMWASMLIGYGVIPKSYHPLLDEAGELNGLNQLLEQIQSISNQMPSHKAFLSQFCGRN